MRRFIVGWKVLGHERRLSAKLVNYADDFVICCRGTGVRAMAAMQDMMAKLKLTVNTTKTKLCRLPEETFDFLGDTVGRCFNPRTGRTYLGTTPSDRKVQKLIDEIGDRTRRKGTWQSPKELVAQLNRKIVGWAHYFCQGPVSKAYDCVNRHATRRLREWLCAKYGTPTRGTRQYSDEYLYETLGLVNLRTLRAGFLRATV